MARIITGLVAVAGWLTLLYLQSFLIFWLAISIICLIGANEYYSICLKKDGSHLRVFFTFSTLLPLIATLNKHSHHVVALLIVSLILNACITLFNAAKLSQPLKHCSRQVLVLCIWACFLLTLFFSWQNHMGLPGFYS